MSLDADIINEVRFVLMRASTGTGHHPKALSSYQIAERINLHNEKLFRQMLDQHGMDGQNSIFHLVSRACMHLHGSEELSIHYADARGMAFDVDGAVVRPKFTVIAFYQLV